VLEQHGIPTVVMGTQEFETLARIEARNRGIADLPLALIPHPLGGIVRSFPASPTTPWRLWVSASELAVMGRR
jgi:hypothetical protein